MNFDVLKQANPDMLLGFFLNWFVQEDKRHFDKTFQCMYFSKPVSH